MKLKNIFIKNFRNYQNFSTEFSSKGAIFCGKNGAGKTSILEAIFVFFSIFPFRSRYPEIFIKNDQNFTEISAKTDSENFKFLWEIYPQKKSTFFHLGVKKSIKEILQDKKFFAVLFTPEDLQIPFLSPRDRRKKIDRIIFPLDPNIFQASLKLKKILRQRNALLKIISQHLSKTEELDFFDQKLVEFSEILSSKREEFCQQISDDIRKNYFFISGKKEILEIKFFRGWKGDLSKVLQENRKIEITKNRTEFGAHRDDFVFFLRGKNITEIGSRGEIRSAMLALKLAEKNFIENKVKISPILLLDDVFSELDADRRRKLNEFITNQQIFLTATDIPSRAFLNIKLPIFQI